MTTLVIGWDCDIDELGWGISVAQSDDRNVDVGGFFDGLGVCSRIGDNDEAGFFKRARDVVGEVTWCETTCDGNCAGVGGELEDGALTVRTSGDDTDISWIVNGGNDAGCEDNFLPSNRMGR